MIWYLFSRGSGLELVAYANADRASTAKDRRSVADGFIMCAGACVCCFSKTQKCVTLSTTEAEYVALADTIKETFLCGMCRVFFCLTLELDASQSTKTTSGQSIWLKPGVRVEFETHGYSTPFSAGARIQGVFSSRRRV